MLGHRQARDFLLRAVAADRLPRALLISGPLGIGKRTLGWSLVKEVLRQGEDSAGADRATGKIERGTHPDVRLYDGSGTVSGQIRVDEIREAEDWAATHPLEGPRKVILIAPAERMNLSAANALLKLLEEPPPYGLLLLISSEPQQLLPTIRSRCASLSLEAVAAEELEPWLVRMTSAGSAEAALAARLAEGRPGLALTILQEGRLEVRLPILEELKLLKAEGFAVVFRVAERLASVGDDLRWNLSAALLILRDALALRLGLPGLLNEDLREALGPLADGASPSGLLESAETLEAAAPQAAWYYTPQARMHFLEAVVAGVGRSLRQG